MAWTYEQNFNALTDGDLNGQDSWSGAANYDVSTTNPYEGAKCVQITGDGTERQITRMVTPVNDGIFYVSMRSGDTGHLFALKIYSVDGAVTTINFHPTGPRIWFYNGATPTDLVNPFTANTWYRIGIEIIGDGTFKINVNNGSWSAAYAYQDATGDDDVDQILFETQAGYSGNAAFDFISPNYTANVVYTLNCEIGSFTLTGNDAQIGRLYTLVCETGQFIMTGVDAVLKFRGWTKLSKNVSSWVNGIKNSSIWTKLSK